MTKEELKNEAKAYAKRKFDEEEQAYLHDIIVQAYLASAEPREKRIEELEAQIAHPLLLLKDVDLEKAKKGLNLDKVSEDVASALAYQRTVNVDNQIEELEKEYSDNLSLKDEELMCLETEFNTYKSEAKELIENIIKVTWGEGWNYSLDWKVKAEQFLKEYQNENSKI